MSKPEVEVVVQIEVEEVSSCLSFIIHWQRTTVGYVARRSVGESVFDNPDSIIEFQGEG